MGEGTIGRTNITQKHQHTDTGLFIIRRRRNTRIENKNISLQRQQSEYQTNRAPKKNNTPKKYTLQKHDPYTLLYIYKKYIHTGVGIFVKDQGPHPKKKREAKIGEVSLFCVFVLVFALGCIYPTPPYSEEEREKRLCDNNKSNHHHHYREREREIDPIKKNQHQKKTRSKSSVSTSSCSSHWCVS